MGFGWGPANTQRNLNQKKKTWKISKYRSRSIIIDGQRTVNCYCIYFIDVFIYLLTYLFISSREFQFPGKKYKNLNLPAWRWGQMVTPKRLCLSAELRITKFQTSFIFYLVTLSHEADGVKSKTVECRQSTASDRKPLSDSAKNEVA